VMAITLGGLGILGFSFSLPATKLAVEGLDPWFVAFGRATVAAVLAAVVLLAARAERPAPGQLRRLAIVAGGVVVGFPLLTTLALQTAGAAHGAVVIAVLPAATAAVAVVRAGERPSAAFWAAALAGLAIVAGYALVREHGALSAADALLLAAVAACAVGYAEGGALARELGGARTICWALILAAGPSAAIAAVAAARTGLHAPASAWFGFAYVSAISMFLGFFAWYAGLARGGVARISQVQLAQPLLTLLWSAAILGEAIGASTLLAAAGALACVAVTQRARVRGATAPAGRARANDLRA
jgi:drug/metabolite transporter (DMT)-like permease